MIEGIEEDVEKKLREDQESKEFKDAGKRIGGSKKERSAYRSLIRVSDLKSLEEDSATAIEMVVKDKVYPKVVPEEEMDKGVTSGAAYLKTEIRASFPAKPKKPNAEHRRAYVGMAETLYQDLSPCITVHDIKDVTDRYYNWKASDFVKVVDLPEMKTEENEEILNRQFSTYKIWRIIEELFGATFYNLIFRGSESAKEKWTKAENFNARSKEQEEINLKNWNERVEKEAERYKEKIRQYREASIGELKELRKNWTGNLSREPEAFRDEAINHYNQKLQQVLPLIDKLADSLKAREESWSWTGKEKKKSEKKTEIQINSGVPLSYIKRLGGLEIKTVNEHEIIKLFGFTGVEFGNYVKDMEAKEHIRHFLGACADLFEILNYNAIQINQLNHLSISFGSRGHGKAMATYYPFRRIINITKSRGDGTVAHEWSHYLDHLIYNKVIGKESMEPFLTYHVGHIHRSELKGEILPALANIMNYIRKGDGTEKKVKAFFLKQDQYSAIRFKAATPEESIQKVRDSDQNYFRLDYYSNAKELQKKVFGYIAHIHNLPYLEVELINNKTSYYYHYSSQLSKYWTEPWELFARAFETYIYDKLERQGRVNNYLVSGGFFNHDSKVYPQGKEREDLFELYDKLMEAIKKELHIADFIPFSEVRTDEYIQFDEASKEEKVKKGVVVAGKGFSPLLYNEAKLFKLMNG